MSKKKSSSPRTVAFGFENDCITLPVESILPVRVIAKTTKSSRKYRQITASIREVGLVEPPVVARNPDDEAFTYNKRISRLAPIQEHRMILRAVERGVSEEKIALALDLNPSSIRRKVRLLDGICEEAIAILKDKPCTSIVFDVLRKMNTVRQIEAADLLVNANNYSAAYASALLAGTPQAQLVETTKPKRIKGITPEAMGRMERELARLQEGMASIKDSYGKDHLQLTVIKGYLAKLLGNIRVVKYLMQHRPEFLAEFQAITEMASTWPPEAE
jgi:hypothetical protein